jgi:hypothetical protein
VPECISQEIRLNLELTAGLPAAALWGAGYNRAAASAITNNAWDWTLESKGTRTALFDKDTLGTTLVTPCRGGWEECWKFDQKSLELRANAKPLNDMAKLYIDYYPELGASFQQLAPHSNFEWAKALLPAGSDFPFKGTNGSCPVPAPEAGPEASGTARAGMAMAMLTLVLLH